MAQRNHNDWISQTKTRGWGDFLLIALDVLEPFGPLSAQLIWTVQPALGLLVGHAFLGALAEALEEPGGIEALRRQLEEDAPPG